LKEEHTAREVAEEEAARRKANALGGRVDPAWYASDEYRTLFRAVFTSGHAHDGNSVELAEAAFEGEIETTKELLRLGYDLESHDTHGFTALSEAACNGQDALVELLLSLGAGEPLSV
jgi:ankyrin repeat protein